MTKRRPGEEWLLQHPGEIKAYIDIYKREVKYLRTRIKDLKKTIKHLEELEKEVGAREFCASGP